MSSRNSLSTFGRRLALVMAFAGFGIAPAAAQNVQADWDKSANFASFKTYSWGTSSMPAGANPLMVQRAQSAVDAEMTAIGFLKVDKDSDVVVVMQGATQTETSLNSFGYAPRFGGGTVTVDKVLVGMLVVNLGNARTKQLIFRGTASDTISDNPQKNEKKIHKAVEKIFEKYPGNAPK